MSYDFELEEILSSVKKNKTGEPPKPSEPKPKTELLRPSEPKPKPKAEPLPPPKPKAESKPEKKPEEPKKEKPAEPKTDKSSYKQYFKSKQFRTAIIVFAALALITGAVFGGIEIYKYASHAYIKQYSEKYGFQFPDGILRELCDAYGEDQTLAGELIIEDTDTDKYVYTAPHSSSPKLAKGSDVFTDQHFRTILLDRSVADIEKIYSTPEGYAASSQKVVFNTLFSKDTYKVIAAFYTNTKPEDDKTEHDINNGYVYPVTVYGNLTKKSLHSFVDRVKSRRLYDTGYEILADNYILTVAAPSSYMQDFRFVIICIKTDKVTKTDKAEPNEKIHYPQIWYDKKGLDNPYYLRGQWYPEIIDGKTGETVQLTSKDFE